MRNLGDIGAVVKMEHREWEGLFMCCVLKRPRAMSSRRLQMTRVTFKCCLQSDFCFIHLFIHLCVVGMRYCISFRCIT